MFTSLPALKQLNIRGKMKRFPIIAILLLIFCIACQNSVKQEQAALLKTNFYDSIENKNLKLLDSLKLTQWNDSAKWRLYTLHCDDTTKQDKDNLPISSLQLKLTYVSILHDTLDLLYSFMANDSTPIKKYSGEEHITDGLQFKTSDGKVIGLIRGDAIVKESGVKSRYENPLQPEVIAFIKKNKVKLNPWFREEAKRRKIID